MHSTYNIQSTGKQQVHMTITSQPMSFENKKDPTRRLLLFARQFRLSNLNIISEAGLKVRLSYKMTNLSNHTLYAQVTDVTRADASGSMKIARKY